MWCFIFYNFFQKVIDKVKNYYILGKYKATLYKHILI